MFINKNTLQTVYEMILEESGMPPVMLLGRGQFEKYAKCKVDKGIAGKSDTNQWLIWVNKNQRDIPDLFDTIWHEILHCMFPLCPEEWIQLCTSKLSGVKADVEEVYDVPSKEELLKWMRSISRLMRGEVK